MQGKIIKSISNDYTVLLENKEYTCKGKGKFRLENIKPMVGDNVEIDIENNIITNILPRKNELIRPVMSNIDQAYIICSVKKPNFDSNLLDKMLTIIEFNNIKPIICFTKLDLLTKEETTKIKKIINYYSNIGYKTFINTEIEEIKQSFNSKISVFTGQTGAGKSTLLNHLDTKLNIRTNEISIALGRGKNTTTHVELLKISDGLVADSPGFSDVSFIGMTPQDIRDNFIEFNEYKENCKYRDCMHNKEDDCEIKRKVEENIILKSRYENYLKFINR